jgi:hypothetical protein
MRSLGNAGKQRTVSCMASGAASFFQSSPHGVADALTVREMTRRGIVILDGSDGAQVFGNLSADNQASGIAIVTSVGATVFGNESLRNIGGAGVRLGHVSAVESPPGRLCARGAGSRRGACSRSLSGLGCMAVNGNQQTAASSR